MSRRITRRAALALVAAPALAPGLARAQAAPLRRVTIPSTGDGLHYMPVYLARAAGLFRDEGLEAEWLNVTGGTRQAAAVMGGSAEMSPLAMIHVMKAQAEGADLVAFCPVFDVYAMSVVLSNAAIAKAGIAPGMALDERVRRLAGLRLGISSPGSSADAVIRSLLLARGMDPDRAVRLQPLGNGASILAAFEKGLVDGFVWTAPAPELAVARGLGQVVVDPFSGEIPEQRGLPYVVMATSRATWAAKPEVILAATRAMARAMRLAHEDGPRAQALLRPYFPDIDDTVFAAAVETYRQGVPRRPVVTPENVSRTAEWLAIGGDKVDASYAQVVLPQPGAAAAGLAG